MKIPADLYYTETHEWVKIEGTTATVGITDHAQNLLGDVVYLQLPNVGKAVVPKAPVAVVESVKAASDIYAPLSGTVTAINEAPVADPSLVNRSPYDEAWMFRLELTNPTEVAQLLKRAADYQSLIAT